MQKRQNSQNTLAGIGKTQGFEVLAFICKNSPAERPEGYHLTAAADLLNEEEKVKGSSLLHWQQEQNHIYSFWTQQLARCFSSLSFFIAGFNVIFKLELK